MKCIIGGQVVLPYNTVTGKAVVFDDRIADIVDESALDLSKFDEVIDAKGAYVAPGLVDIHIHGYLGEDTSDGKVEGLEKMARGIAENGVTAWCPTTMTVAKDQIVAAFDAARKLKAKEEYYGAKVLGINCEGPFINPGKKGAQAEEHIQKPDAAFIKEHSDIVKLFTIAPEMDDDCQCIKEVARDTDVLISMGHTGADFDEARRGIDAGVRHATHLFNAMTPLQHRNPGVVGAALSDDRVSCELICDTFHVNPGLYTLVSKCKGDNLVLITDCIRAGGLEDGEYDLGGQNVTVRGIKCLLADGTIAGSVLKLNRAVHNLLSHTTLSVCDAVRAASLNPARAIGEDKDHGSLEVGKCADIIIADSDFNIIKTIIGGVTRYEH